MSLKLWLVSRLQESSNKSRTEDSRDTSAAAKRTRGSGRKPRETRLVSRREAASAAPAAVRSSARNYGLWTLGLCGCAVVLACGSSSSGNAAGTGSAGSPAAAAGGATDPSQGGAAQIGGAPGVEPPPCGELASFVAAYKAAHPGNGGKDWDINAKTPAELAADPDAQRLMALCGEDRRPVIPILAWEYGGADHAWISPEQSALAYCVYTPVAVSSANWTYDAGQDNVTADVYVACPDQNPCAAETGANLVAACIGDPTNFEILVDTASYNDGADVGLRLSNASTALMLVLPDKSKVLLHNDI
jgi:hypothetical protein